MPREIRRPWLVSGLGSQEFFGRWDDCPTEERCKGGRWWEFEWAHERAAPANFSRYDYADINNIRVIQMQRRK
jgi:hypothetical protein